MKLYTYWRSSAAYRVRIALNLKGLAFDSVPVDLTRGAGEHRQPAYLKINPQGLVPALDVDGAVLRQSVAILEYLEEQHPEPALLPVGSADKALVRGLVQVIACDIHPILNLRILKYLKNELKQEQDMIDAWYRHWIAAGLEPLEDLVAVHGDGRFCVGESVTLADVCLVPQLYNAHRFDCDVSPYPHLNAVEAHLLTLPEFANAAPERQPDAPEALRRRDSP